MLAAVVGQQVDFRLLKTLTGFDEAELLPPLKELIAAQLLIEESADGFAFRHALTRQSVLSGLLIRERRQLHRQVAETIERLYESDIHTWSGDLAYHFYEAQEWSRALNYGRQAGEKAQRLYSPRMAVIHFSRAIEAADHLSVADPELLRLRGQVYEVLGEFEAAHNDYLHAAEIAQNTSRQWQSWMDLGWLWTGRDYQKAGDYFQRAIEFARRTDDPIALGQALNRVGNWHVHQNHPQEAIRCHEEALTVFRQSEDSGGLAATLDLLGITHFMIGNFVRGAGYYEQAVMLLRQGEDRQALANTLANYAIRGANYIGSTAVWPKLA